MRKLYLFIFFLSCLAGTLSAQMPNDGIMMSKHQLCILGQYSHSSWDKYWEGDNKRSNANLGTFTGQSAMIMGNYGITDRLNVLLGLPYIWTEGSATYLQGQRGIQDLSAWLKYHPIALKTSAGVFNVMATGGLSTPLTKYVNDFLPFSIGLGAKTASLRGILNYTFEFGLYATAQGGHTWRSNITIDRDAYLYNNQLYYTDEVPVPHVADGSFRLGFIKPRFQTELWIERSACTDGDDIRYNDAPFPTNKMSATAAGWFGKGFITKQLALQVAVSKVLNGRNAGQATTIAAGATYFFSLGRTATATQQ